MEQGDKKTDLFAAVREALAAPPKIANRRSGGVRGLVGEMLPDLLKLREHGYTDMEIADIFRRKGFKVAASTLKNYINEARAAQSGVTSRKTDDASSKQIISPRSRQKFKRPSTPEENVPEAFSEDSMSKKRNVASSALEPRLSDKDV
jgi:hypothetical protein